MTLEEKKERRELSHRLQKACAKKINRVTGLWMTPAQVRMAARKMRDRIVAAGVQSA